MPSSLEPDTDVTLLSSLAGEPRIVVFGWKNDRHPIVDLGDQVIRLAREKLLQEA
jgi:hypothetical protein